MSVDKPAPEPTLQSATSFPTYGGPGWAEIKPHNVEGIRAGLRQLSSRRSARGPGHGRPYIITYNYAMPRSTSGRVLITAYLLRPHGAAISADPAKPVGGQLRPWLDGLGMWWSLGPPVAGPEQSLAEWRRSVGPTVFGHMLDPFLRQAFVVKFGVPEAKHLSKLKLPSVEGADVDWLEVAEFLYELAAELGGAA
jgi:hypothetical protein